MLAGLSKACKKMLQSKTATIAFVGKFYFCPPFFSSHIACLSLSPYFYPAQISISLKIIYNKRNFLTSIFNYENLYFDSFFDDFCFNR